MRYEASFEINTHDIDFNDNLTPSNLLKYLNEAGNMQMRARRPSYEEFFEQGLAFIVTRNTIEIYDSLHKYDKFTVQTWPCPSRA